MDAKPAPPDDRVARIAVRQHGVVSLAQLREAGVNRGGVARRVQAGRLHRVRRGVYAVGHRGLSPEGRWLAAVIAHGADAVLSHASAAALWRLLPEPGVIHVSILGRPGRTRRAGIRLHRPTTLDSTQTTRRLNIPVTTPSRTLHDLRRTVPGARFAAALRQAEVLGLPLDEQLEPDWTRSELEARFLRLCRRHRLPRPRVNTRLGAFVVDFLWPAQRLVVELDGYRFHRGRSAFEADRTRDAELKLRGYEVIRITWRRLSSEPAQVAATLRRLLQARSAGQPDRR
jgi:very-short-patch-repair endonuclease